MRPCNWCAKDFQPASRNQAYCCDECRHEGRRSLDRAAWQQRRKTTRVSDEELVRRMDGYLQRSKPVAYRCQSSLAGMQELHLWWGTDK